MKGRERQWRREGMSRRRKGMPRRRGKDKVNPNKDEDKVCFDKMGYKPPIDEDMVCQLTKSTRSPETV